MSKVRRCDDRCHSARGKRCNCFCGGFYHGKDAGAANRAVLAQANEDEQIALLEAHGFKKGKTAYIEQTHLPISEDAEVKEETMPEKVTNHEQEQEKQRKTVNKSPTVADWIEHFKAMQATERDVYKKALQTLLQDSWIRYHWSADFSSLEYAIKCSETKSI